MNELTGLIAALASLIGSVVGALAWFRAREASKRAGLAAVTAGAIHSEVASPNGTTTGETVQKVSDIQDQIAEDVADLRREQSSMAVQIGKHLSDGHGGR